jgi:phage baseplate assembly protein W
MSYTFSDVPGDFRRNPVTGDIDLLFDEDAIAQAIKNIVYFNNGEVVFQPTGWGSIERELFEPMTPITVKSLRDRITTAIKTKEDRIEQLSVEVTPLREENGYSVVVSYLPKKSINPVSLELFLERSV